MAQMLTPRTIDSSARGHFSSTSSPACSTGTRSDVCVRPHLIIRWKARRRCLRVRGLRPPVPIAGSATLVTHPGPTGHAKSEVARGELAMGGREWQVAFQTMRARHIAILVAGMVTAATRFVAVPATAATQGSTAHVTSIWLKPRPATRKHRLVQQMTTTATCWIRTSRTTRTSSPASSSPEASRTTTLHCFCSRSHW